MSRKPIKLVPTVPSAAIPDQGFISTNELIGSARQGIKPIFAISRTTMEGAIIDGRLPPPIRLLSNAILWESRVIKALVADLEAQEQGA
jgi:hypothetical protein